jgi:naphthoate synthase
MGLVNAVVPPDKLMETAMAWAQELLEKSPTALKLAKYSFNADTAQIGGLGRVAFSAVDLYYQTPEAKEGRTAFVEKRPADFRRFRR